MESQIIDDDFYSFARQSYFFRLINRLIKEIQELF